MSKTILGLDLGSNSLGWALLAADNKDRPTDIIDLGVRIFPKAVEEKTPTPKMQKRRNSRLARRIIQRRSRRKQKLLNFLIKINLLPLELKGHLQPEMILNTLGDPYQLRAKALDHDLTPHELGRVLLHLVQRRGFLSNKKILLGHDMQDDPDLIAVLGEEEKLDDNGEEGDFKKEISALRLEIKNAGFRTLGEYLASKSMHECKRNRDGQHIRTDRRMYLEELALIFKRQAGCHRVLTDEVQAEIEDIIFFQRPLKLKPDRVGKCSLETNKKRIAKARLEYQQFRYLQDINSLKYFDPNTEQWIKLTQQDKQTLKPLFETSEKLTFAALRKVLGLQKGTKFNLEIDTKHLKGNTTFVTIHGVLPQWDSFDEQEKQDLVEDLLSIKKKSALKQRLMTHWKLSGEQALQLCLLEFEPGYGNHSLKAIKKLLPHLDKGLIYSKAREAAGYGKEDKELNPQDKLGVPPELPNPIVNKGLHELRRVVNALIAEYGKPDIIRIEMARDLEMNTEKYNNFIRQQRINTKLNERANEAFRGVQTDLNASKYPSRDQKIKYRLWLDQNHCCAYSGKTISLKTLFSADIEIDHILPYSLSLDDSYINKVICFAKENQLKGQKTPKDAFAGNEEKWNQITQALTKWPKQLDNKKKRFYKVADDLKERDFIETQLNDTRYMSREAGQYLKTLGSDITFSKGIVTSWLRSQWNLNSLIGTSASKDRDDHRHHAIDAAVTACIDRSLYQRLVATAKSLEETGSELNMYQIRVKSPLPDIRNKLADKLGDIIIAHTPLRKLTGALHEETGVGFIEGIGNVYRRRLDPQFDLKAAAKIIDPVVKKLVVEHLENYDGKAKEAFAPDFKLLHLDNKTQIKRVRVVQSKTTKESLEKNKFAIKDKAGKPFKWHAYGNIHHVEILRNKNTQKYRGEFVTMLEASARARGILRKKTPIIQSNHGDEWEFLMALHINDLVELTDAGIDRIYRVQKLDRGTSRLVLRLHRAATLNNSEQSISGSIKSLCEDFKMKSIKVNAIGKRLND
jgi:CRISPR-associated endonuclease Csn1